jgi:hypothetical protein
VDTQELVSRQARAERAARIPLIVGLVTLPPSVAVLIWVLGFSSSPQHAGYAFTVGGITAVILAGPQWLVYRVRLNRLRSTASATSATSAGAQQNLAGRRELSRNQKRVAYAGLILAAAVPFAILAGGVWGLLTVEHTRGQLLPVPGGIQTTGTVVGVQSYCNAGCTYEPAIEYTDLRGRAHRFTAPYQSEYPAAGSKVKVSYSPLDPAGAHDISVSPSSWDLPLGTAIFAIVLGGLSGPGAGGVVVTIAVRRRAQRQAKSALPAAAK